MARSSTVYKALQALTAFNLVQQNSGRWSIVAMRVVTYLETAVGEKLQDPVVAETESALDVLERILGARRLA